MERWKTYYHSPLSSENPGFSGAGQVVENGSFVGGQVAHLKNIVQSPGLGFRIVQSKARLAKHTWFQPVRTNICQIGSFSLEHLCGPSNLLIC